MTSIRNGEVVNYCALNRIFSSLAPFHFCGANGSFSCVLRHFSFYRFLSLHSFTCVNPLLLVFLVFSFFLPFSLSLSPFLSVSPFISSYLSFLYLYRFPSNGALSLPHWHTSHLSCSSSSTFFFPSPSWKSNHFYSFRLPLPISNPQPHFEPFEKALRFGSKPVSSIHFYSYYLYAFFFLPFIH